MEDNKLNGAVPLSDDEVPDVSGGTFGEINQLALVMNMEVRNGSSFTEVEDLQNYITNISEELKKYDIISSAMLATHEGNVYLDKSGNTLTHRQVLEQIADKRGIRLIFN